VPHTRHEIRPAGVCAHLIQPAGSLRHALVVSWCRAPRNPGALTRGSRASFRRVRRSC
jgi:hypothetical protein